jgi:hypothetical protein
MPRNKLNSINLPKFYQRQVIDYILYGTIKGMKLANPSLSVESCVFNTLQHYNISDNFDPETIKWIYHKMDSLLLENKGLQ